MHHFVANATWEDAAVLPVGRDLVLAEMERHGPVAASEIDDTGFPKKAPPSVGVARQYCGVLGKPYNCQVAVSLSLANEVISVPVAYQLSARCVGEGSEAAIAGVPPAILFRTKWQIALEQVRALSEAGLQPAPVSADAGYGMVTDFRDHRTARGLP